MEKFGKFLGSLAIILFLVFIATLLIFTVGGKFDCTVLDLIGLWSVVGFSSILILLTILQIGGYFPSLEVPKNMFVRVMVQLFVIIIGLIMLIPAVDILFELTPAIPRSGISLEDVRALREMKYGAFKILLCLGTISSCILGGFLGSIRNFLLKK